MRKKRSLLVIFVAGVIVGRARSRKESPNKQGDQSPAAKENTAQHEEGLSQPIENDIEPQFTKNNERNKLHDPEARPVSSAHEPFSFRRAIDGLASASLGWAILFTIAVGLYTAAVSIRVGEETLEIGGLAVAAVAAALLAEGFMKIVIEGWLYVTLGLFVVLGVGITVLRVDVLPKSHWYDFGGLALAVLLGGYLAWSRGRSANQRKSSHTPQDARDLRQVSMQALGLLLLMTALAVQLRLAVFEHPTEINAVAEAVQKTDRLPPDVLIPEPPGSKGHRRAVISVQISQLQQNVCLIEQKLDSNHPRNCSKHKTPTSTH